MLEKGAAFECDSCKKVMVVVAVRQMPQVVLAQAGSGWDDVAQMDFDEEGGP